MDKKRALLIIVGAVLVVGSALFILLSEWVQHYTYAFILPFSAGCGILVMGLIPTWWSRHGARR